MREPAILDDDGDLVVVAKPAGWVVYAARAGETQDLRAWLAGARPGRPPEPLHRLDRETSGLVLYARRAETRARWGEAFAAGRVEKTYLALVVGHAHSKGVIRTPLAPDHPGPPQPAVTRYRLLEALGGFSWIRVSPETGRKHQIRRHLAEIGLPVVGDARHGRRGVRVPAFPGRLFLHAAALELEGRRFEAPLPEELERCLAAVRAGAGRGEPPAG